MLKQRSAGWICADLRTGGGPWAALGEGGFALGLAPRSGSADSNFFGFSSPVPRPSPAGALGSRVSTISEGHTAMAAKIYIERMMHRSSIAVLGETAATYALLKLIPSGSGERPMALNIALVLDVSGSMYEED